MTNIKLKPRSLKDMPTDLSMSSWIKKDLGFTLIELLVVVALIGLIALFALPSVTNFFKLSLNSCTREMASVIKETYNSTAMTGRVHRVVFDLTENQFWTEVGPDAIMLHTSESKEKEERRKKFQKPDEQKKGPNFSLDKTVTKKKLTLPRGVTFEDILTEQSPEVITEGTAFTHFFSHGLVEQTLIHLKDTSNHHITLMINPLIGKTKLFERYVSKDEAYAISK